MEYVIAFFVVLSVLISGSLIKMDTEWYRCIKPRQITPPAFVFPIVWFVLYFILFLAFARALKQNQMVWLFGLLFLLNVLWSYVFFGKKQVVLGAILIILNIILNICMIGLSLHRGDVHMAKLLAPHLAWICFAFVLNLLCIKKVKMCRNLYF